MALRHSMILSAFTATRTWTARDGRIDVNLTDFGVRNQDLHNSAHPQCSYASDLFRDLD